MRLPKVLVLESEYESIGKAVDRVLDDFPLDVKGKSILLKPNMLGPYPPDSHVNTHPSLVRALVERLQGNGAEVSVGDNTGTQGYGSVEKSAEVSGIKEASLGTFLNLSREVEKTTLPGREAQVNVSRKVLDCDILLSLPKFKTHTFTRITGAIKNSFGIIVGGDKARLHLDFPGYRAFSEILVDVYRIRIPDLVIMDGIVGIQGNGPSNKDYYPAGKVLASDNGVSLDSVMAQMMGMRPEKVRSLEYASKLGLGEIDPSRIEIEGKAGKLRRFRKPVPGLGQVFGGTWVNLFLPDIGRPRFDVDPDLCNSCGKCREHCPTGAINMEDKEPSYDYSKCIACYCCMELCPKQAITLHETIRTRLYRIMGHIQ